MRIPYTAHVTNEEVRRRTGQPPVTCTIVSRRLRLFGHIARADPSQDHFRALQAAINRLPTDWRRRRGRPRRTWLRIESDLVMYNVADSLAACGHVGVATRAGGVLFVTRRARAVAGVPTESVECY